METSILLVDDETDILDVCRMFLEDAEYRVYTALDGKSALTLYRQIRPPIAILDIRLPGMNGIDLLQAIKAIDPDTEVIMITGHGDLDTAIRSLRHDAADFILKPIDVTDLSVALQRARTKISHRLKAREAIQNRAMIDMVLNELIREDVLVVSADYRVTDINESMLRKLKLTRPEAVGRVCHELLHQRGSPCEGEGFNCPLIQTGSTGTPSQMTHSHLDQEGREHQFSISCYPLVENGKVTSIIEICREITQDLDRQKKWMEQEKMASIGLLAAGVAHEINNPMTTILTSAMILQEETTPIDPANDELRLIVSEALRCRRIVNGLLEFARQSKPTKTAANLNEIVEACLLLTRKQAGIHEVTLDAHLAGDLPRICLDKDLIQQAIMNLLINAIEAAGAQGGVDVTSRCLPENRGVEVAVCDTGPGIAPEMIERIFDPFYTTKKMGTGLGLAVTHGIMEQHGGKIEVSSIPGQKTCFRIRLPLKTPF
jgi:two-component system, NtrC family, sensor kinase